MAMIVEGRGGRRMPVPVSSGIPDSPPERRYVEICSTQFTERLNLILLTLEKLLIAEPERAPMVSAFLLHAVILNHIPLSARRMREIQLSEESSLSYREFLDDFAIAAYSEISHPGWAQLFDKCGVQCDVVDMVDGRVFKAVVFMIQGRADARKLLPEKIVKQFDTLTAYLEKKCAARLGLEMKCDLRGKDLVPVPERDSVPPILAFSNAVFDLHLATIRIDVDVLDSPVPGDRPSKIFREISHWHNSKRPIDKIQASRIHNDKARQRLLRAQQRYMGEMLKYAASLTNASGKILDPQTITVQKDVKSTVHSVNVNAKKQEAPHDFRKGKQGGKKPISSTRELAQASINNKRDIYAEKTFSSWANMREIFDKIADPEARYQRTKIYSQDLPTDKLKIVKAEIMLYNLQPLLEIWVGFCRENKKEDGYKIAALIWDQIQCLWKLEHGLTNTIMTCALEVCRLLELPADRETPATAPDRPLTFAFKTPPVSSYTLSVGLPPREFQLLYCGPYMDRNMDSRPDPRVPFNPDGWQRAVLDELDANHSVFVVAPTSAGKTFISFYATEKVLRADDDGVLVYVAPTKALVNQIGAEIQARFSKAYKHGGKSVWAIHTRDYRVNNPTGCQVLVTLPAILQIMLLSPSNARSWAPRVKRIIFDEIHSIGQAEDGVIWEQLLLLAPCPIIALSATVGNPEQFNDWLASTQRSSNFLLTMIQHQHRYSDLRKFMYNPPERFTLTGLSKRSTLGDIGLDGISRFQFFHPVASLVNKSRGIPADLSLEPRDCLTLWQTMANHQTPDYPLPESLDPKTSCPLIIAKADVIAWERELKKRLSAWMLDSDSPFDKVLHDLLNPLETLSPQSATPANAKPTDLIDPYDLCATALPLVTDLHERGALPAILFNYDRSACEAIAQSLLQSLELAEDSWKKTSPRWKYLIEGYEKWKAAKKKEPSRTAAKSKKKTGKDADADIERLSKTDIERESGDREGSQYESFDPDAPCEEFSFADKQKVEAAEMEGFFNKLTWNGVSAWLLTALTRGIGVHHAGMNRKYRQT
jgi:ATP-dependent RNA helicase DDX60